MDRSFVLFMSTWLMAHCKTDSHDGYISLRSNIYCLVRGAEYCDQFVCLSVCLQGYLWNRWTDLHEIFCAGLLWQRLGPPLAAL